MKRARLEASRIAAEQKAAAKKDREKHGEVAFEAASATAEEASLLGRLGAATTSAEVQATFMQRMFGALQADTWTMAKFILRAMGKAGFVSFGTGYGYFSSVAATLLWSMLPPGGKESTMTKLRLFALEIFTSKAKTMLKLGCISALAGGAMTSVAFGIASIAVQRIAMYMTPKMARMVYHLLHRYVYLELRTSQRLEGLIVLLQGMGWPMYDVLEGLVLAYTPVQ
eukprot:1058544-Prymnesium_polylepis.1